MLIKLVNGVTVPCSAAEETVFLQEWAANSPLPPLTPDQLEVQCATALSGDGSQINLLKLIKSVALWQAQLHAKTGLQARNEIAAIYKTL